MTTNTTATQTYPAHIIIALDLGETSAFADMASVERCVREELGWDWEDYRQDELFNVDFRGLVNGRPVYGSEATGFYALDEDDLADLANGEAIILYRSQEVELDGLDPNREITLTSCD